MEVLALAGLLGVGYMLTKKDAGAAPEAAATEEHFASQEDARTLPDFPPMGGQPPQLFQQDRTTPAQGRVPGLPLAPQRTADGGLDLYYNLPSGGSLSTNPYSDQDLYQRRLVFAEPAPAIVPQAPLSSVTAQVRMNTDGREEPPVYHSGQTVISPLTGLPMPATEFSHNNMVPYYKGSVKQNMTEDAMSSRLDYLQGAGSTVISKREQAPLFEPSRAPTGNVNGLESATDFMQDRVVVPTNRAFEKLVEPTRVGPGLDQGYTSFPTGGFQQFETLEIAKQRATVDDLRVASNPKLTYEMPMISGKAVNDQPAQIGEVRKYRPDTFYLNEHGERNFATVGENSKPTERPAQVVKFQQREETSVETFGPAAMTESKATYTVPSFRAPFATQLDGFGWRNADGSTYGVSNTDAPNNDFGRSGVDLPTNQRNVVSERTHRLNLTMASGPKAMTVYDPNDVARTTIRETTGAVDYAGIAGLAGAPQKLTVYDPTDIMKPTGRNTLAEPDKAMNVTRAGVGAAATLPLQDDVRMTTKSLVGASAYSVSPAGQVVGGPTSDYTAAYNMRTNPTKEVISSGRRPIAGNGSLALFNGEDWMNVSYRKIEADRINDRDTTSDRVVGPPIGVEAIGVQRPRQPLKLDVSVDRNINAILESLNDNPYALPIHRIATGQAGPAEISSMMSGGGSAW
jgi:hypothetical protein